MSVADIFNFKGGTGLCKLYRQLHDDECIELAKIAVELLSGKDERAVDQAESILVNSALITNGTGLKAIYNHLVEKNYFPNRMGVIYRFADDGIAEKIIHKLETASTGVNNLLMSLVWIKTEHVMNFLQKASEEKADWAKDLYVTPIRYSEESGWIVDKNNKLKSLIYDKCLLPVDSEEVADVEIAVNNRLIEKCPACGNTLNSLFMLDLDNPVYSFLGLKGEKINIAACLECAIYEPYFMSAAVKRELDNGGETLKFKDIGVLGSNLFSDDIPGTQIGGHPNWVNDAFYPECPHCKNKMMFIGQQGDELSGYEGTFFCFICPECLETCVLYDQS